MTDVETRKAIEYIGANIQAYRHFALYDIPNEDGSDLDLPVSRERLLQLVYEYYHKRDRFTPSDLCDVEYARECKSWLRSQVNDESYQIGLDWLDNVANSSHNHYITN